MLVIIPRFTLFVLSVAVTSVSDNPKGSYSLCYVLLLLVLVIIPRFTLVVLSVTVTSVSDNPKVHTLCVKCYC